MKVGLVFVLMMASVFTSADNTGFAKLFIGSVDSFRDNQDSQYGIEYEWAEGLTRYQFKPAVGLIRTRDQSHFLYGAFNRTSKFTSQDTGLALTFSLGAGLYAHGGGEDTDLGSWFEIRSSAGLVWLFADETRLGLHFAHLSNASLAQTNPGTELLTFTYELPW